MPIYDTNNPSPIFEDKQNSLLYRAKLQSIINEAIEKPVVTIVAGPGYGKSAAVSSFLADKQKRATWVSLTEMDNVATRLWEHLAKIIHFNQEDSFGKLMRIGFPESEIAFENYIKIISNEIVGYKKYYLILDDFYHITNPVIIRFFEKIISARIKGLCIIIISRYEPPINTISLLSKNLLYRINEDSLRLTKDEISEFFKMRGIMLSSQAVSDFHIYTEGWVFATQLVCLALKKDVLYKKNPLAAVKLDIYSLLESEVFSGLSEALQNFLIKLSLFESLPMELLTLLAEKDHQQVEQVLKIKSFIMYDSFTNTYRIHQLFLSFLREKHSFLAQPEMTEIYLMAAQWYAQNGYGIDAITHYEKIGYYEHIVDILLTYTGRFPADTIDFLLGVIDRMPDKLLKEKPILRVLSAKYSLNNFKSEEAYQKLGEIRTQFEALPLTAETKAVLGEIYILFGFQSLMTCPFTRTYEFKDYFRKADEYMPLGSKLNIGLHYNFGNYTCNVLSSEKGELEKMIEAVKVMEPYSSRVLQGAGMGYECSLRAEYAYFQKDMKNAEKYAYQAIAKAHEGNQYDIENYALFLLARIGTASGSYVKVMDILAKQNQLVQRVNYTEAYAVHDITSGWFYAQIGQTHMVPEWIKDELKSKEVMSPISFAVDKLVRAKCLLADNKIYELLALIDAKSEGFSFETYICGLIEMKVLKAIALNLIKEYKESAEIFQEAYELAYPSDLILPFIENGKYTRTLIGAVSQYCKIPEAWLENIRIKSSSYAKRLGSMATAYTTANMAKYSKPNLSKREKEILIDLCQGLTREEIADNCGMSVNTVKSMILSIYRKLGVNNNFEAISVASHLDLMN